MQSATRYTYGYGYKTREDAFEAMDTMFCDGEIDQCARPQVETYKVLRESDGKAVTRYKITLDYGI